eukprot:scaffold822_cov250-Pinguiococcus_pyrenoidosus.AAC.13
MVATALLASWRCADNVEASFDLCAAKSEATLLTMWAPLRPLLCSVFLRLRRSKSHLPRIGHEVTLLSRAADALPRSHSPESARTRTHCIGDALVFDVESSRLRNHRSRSLDPPGSGVLVGPGTRRVLHSLPGEKAPSSEARTTGPKWLRLSTTPGLGGVVPGSKSRGDAILRRRGRLVLLHRNHEPRAGSPSRRRRRSGGSDKESPPRLNSREARCTASEDPEGFPPTAPKAALIRGGRGLVPGGNQRHLQRRLGLGRHLWLLRGEAPLSRPKDAVPADHTPHDRLRGARLSEVVGAGTRHAIRHQVVDPSRIRRIERYLARDQLGLVAEVERRWLGLVCAGAKANSHLGLHVGCLPVPLAGRSELANSSDWLVDDDIAG